MPLPEDSFIEPTPLSPEHESRFITHRGREPVAFEEVLQNPRGDERRRVRDKDEVRNFRWLYLITVFLFVAMIGRAGFLQIAQEERFRGLAEGNRLRGLILTAPRGILYDRHEEQLVENVPSYEVQLVPVDIPEDPVTREALFKKVSTLVRVPAKKFEEAYQAQDPHSFDPVPVADELPRDTALLLDANAADYPGIKAGVQAIRSYQVPEALSHIVGYVGKLTAEDVESHQDYELTDVIGKAGVEQSYEETLRGNNGAQNVEVDAFGQIVNVLATEEPVPGDDLITTIDLGLQKKLYEELAKAAKRSGKQRAAAVAIDPRNGEVLAFVSVPGYDVNAFAKGIESDALAALLEDPNQPLFTRPTSGSYPPGSTFKPFVAVGALAAKTITPSTTFQDSGRIEVGGQIFSGWKPGGHGTVTVFEAIAHSVNGFFYSIGGGYQDIDGIGINGIDRIAGLFGFGKNTEIDFPTEEDGLLPTPQWKEENYGEQWFLGDTYNASIGQGFVLVTPLQLANATAAIANGGTLWWPHFGKSVIHADGTREEIAPRMLQEKVSEREYVDIVRQGMRLTVDGGTGRLLADLPVQAAGKTGTAQFGTKEPNAWFTSFAPYNEPTIALAILVEQAGDGSDFSAPVAKEVLQYYFTREKP
jgi:penicillin-binding protein 2